MNIPIRFGPRLNEHENPSTHVEFHNNAYKVRLMINGKEVRVAWSLNFMTARRFADLVLCRLGRTTRLNFSQEQVAADLIAHPEANALLDQICGVGPQPRPLTLEQRVTRLEQMLLAEKK